MTFVRSSAASGLAISAEVASGASGCGRWSKSPVTGSTPPAVWTTPDGGAGTAAGRCVKSGSGTKRRRAACRCGSSCRRREGRWASRSSQTGSAPTDYDLARSSGQGRRENCGPHRTHLHFAARRSKRAESAARLEVAIGESDGRPGTGRFQSTRFTFFGRERNRAVRGLRRRSRKLSRAAGLVRQTVRSVRQHFLAESLLETARPTGRSRFAADLASRWPSAVCSPARSSARQRQRRAVERRRLSVRESRPVGTPTPERSRAGHRPHSRCALLTFIGSGA